MVHRSRVPLSSSLVTLIPAATKYMSSPDEYLPLFFDPRSESSLLVCLFGWLVGFLTSSSTTRLYRGKIPRLTSDNFTCCHTRDWAGDHDFCLSRSHYTDTNPTSRERESNPGSPHQESHAVPTESPLSTGKDSITTVRSVSCRFLRAHSTWRPERKNSK